MTAETYLRRALLAPILVPALAAVPLIIPAGVGDDGSPMLTSNVASFLLCSLLIGGIPYLWMLYSRREELRRLSGGRLGAALIQMPLDMLPYFWKFWGVVTALLLVTIWGALYGLVFLIVGTLAVPVLGYGYVAATFGFLRAYQWLGLVEREA